MEPANLNPAPAPGDSDARLEALLRCPSRELPDDGFSARVLAALPPPPRHRAGFSRTSAYIVGAAFGTVVALAGTATGSESDEILSSFATAFAPAAARFSDPSVLAAVVVAIVSVAYALRPTLRRRTA